MLKKIAILVALGAVGPTFPACSFNENTEGSHTHSAAFVGSIDNAYFPLTPGKVLTYEGGGLKETLKVVGAVDDIGDDNILATAVKGANREDGKVVEETIACYAQDTEGNVWYLGEHTLEYENRKVSASEMWQHGVDGAEGGIIMKADPAVGDSDWQKQDPGNAEALAWTIEVDAKKSVPAGTFKGAVRTLEFSPLEPELIGEKYYAPGVGLIYERAVTGGVRRLVSVRWVWWHEKGRG